MTAKAPQEIPRGAVKSKAPSAPPTTEYVGKRDLPLLNSERKEYEEKVKKLTQEKDLISSATLRKVTGVINRADFLTEEIKQELLKLIWK